MSCVGACHGVPELDIKSAKSGIQDPFAAIEATLETVGAILEGEGGSPRDFDEEEGDFAYELSLMESERQKIVAQFEDLESYVDQVVRMQNSVLYRAEGWVLGFIQVCLEISAIATLVIEQFFTSGDGQVSKDARVTSIILFVAGQCFSRTKDVIGNKRIKIAEDLQGARLLLGYKAKLGSLDGVRQTLENFGNIRRRTDATASDIETAVVYCGRVSKKYEHIGRAMGRTLAEKQTGMVDPSSALGQRLAKLWASEDGSPARVRSGTEPSPARARSRSPPEQTRRKTFDLEFLNEEKAASDDEGTIHRHERGKRLSTMGRAASFRALTGREVTTMGRTASFRDRTGREVTTMGRTASFRDRTGREVTTMDRTASYVEALGEEVGTPRSPRRRPFDPESSGALERSPVDVVDKGRRRVQFLSTADSQMQSTVARVGGDRASGRSPGKSPRERELRSSGYIPGRFKRREPTLDAKQIFGLDEGSSSDTTGGDTDFGASILRRDKVQTYALESSMRTARRSGADHDGGAHLETIEDDRRTSLSSAVFHFGGDRGHSPEPLPADVAATKDGEEA